MNTLPSLASEQVVGLVPFTEVFSGDWVGTGILASLVNEQPVDLSYTTKVYFTPGIIPLGPPVKV